jgi:hypothetical protein
MTTDEIEPCESKVQAAEFSPVKTSHQAKENEGSKIPRHNFVGRIHHHWQRRPEGFHDLAIACAEADKAVPKAFRRTLMKKLPFSASVFRKLAQIGDDQRLQNEHIRKLLPPCHLTIYEVSRLTDQQLQAALSAGILKPDLKRKELLQWRGPTFRTIAKERASAKLPDFVFEASPENGNRE